MIAPFGSTQVAFARGKKDKWTFFWGSLYVPKTSSLNGLYLQIWDGEAFFDDVWLVKVPDDSEIGE